MRRVMVWIPAMCVIALSVQMLTALAQSTAGDEAAVREVVKNYVAARDRGDAAGVAAVFTEHADQLTSSGEWRRGRDELVRGTLASSKSNSGVRTIAIKTGLAAAASARRSWSLAVLTVLDDTPPGSS